MNVATLLARVGVATGTSLLGSQIERALLAGVADAGKHTDSNTFAQH